MSTPDDKTRLDNLADAPTGAYPSLGDPLVGKMLKDAYHIEGRLGEGGMGVVYRATQVTLSRHVAVKTLHLDNRLPPVAIERFFREAKLLSQLQHPNIVHIIDFGTDGTRANRPIHFMVMEHLHGETLEGFVQARGRLPADLVLDLMEQVCAGVAVAHQSQVIHRDLKPANVFIVQVTGSPRPVVKLLDFGLGKMVESGRASAPGLTHEGVMMGTLCYSAPEQLEGGQVDVRADIYSLGAILYFLLTGRAPYTDEGFRVTLVKQLSQPPDPLEAPELTAEESRGAEAVVLKAMSPRPEDRFRTPGELFAELHRALRPGETLSDRGRASRIDQRRPAFPGRDKPSRRGVLVGAGAALVLGGSALATWAALRRRPALTATAPGVTEREIVLGMSGPFSGPTRELGQALQTGLETCFKHVNGTTGVHGRTVRLVALDDGYEPARAAENMKRLLDEHAVFAFVGNVGTPTTEAALPIALENQRVFFGAYTGAKLLRKDPPDRYVFNYRAGYVEETQAIVRHLVEERKLPPSGIAVFAQNDGYGEAGFEGVARALRRHGIAANEILKVTYERNKGEVRPAFDAVAREKGRVRAVVMVATYRPAARFIKLVRDALPGVTLTNVSFVGSDALAEELREMGPKYGEGVIVTQVVPLASSSATGVLNYRGHLGTYFPQATPGFVSLEGYIVGRVLVQGLLNAGPQLTSETLVEGLEQIKDLDLAIGTKITFGPSDHQGSHKVWGTVLNKDCKYETLDLE
ncbi:MAG: ABC transporter substrate-binding protein [Gemmataceae bacterium]